MSLAHRLHELVESQKDGVKVSLLKKNTKILIETQRSFYDFIIQDGNHVTVSGGLLQDGNTRFPNPVPAVIIGSTWGNAMLKMDWIGHKMHLEFNCDGKYHLTSLIQKITIECDDWHYCIS